MYVCRNGIYTGCIFCSTFRDQQLERKIAGGQRPLEMSEGAAFLKVQLLLPYVHFVDKRYKSNKNYNIVI